MPSPNDAAADFMPQLARVAEEFRPWGIRLGLSVNFASPKLIGGLDTFDPLDPKVAAWWKDKVDQIYRAIPDFGGFVLKADSEGQLGPVDLRPHARRRRQRDRARAEAAWRDTSSIARSSTTITSTGHNLKNDRAEAAYDNFHPLDGKFDDNVIIQIKHGPIDFQVREPASPLFGGLEKTNEAIELQITQEYLGQQRHLVFLPPMWKEVLDFDLQANGGHTPVKEIVAGKTFPSADRRVRRSRQRRPGRELAGQSSGDGKSLRLRPAGLESGPKRRSHCRGMDAADFRQ